MFLTEPHEDRITYSINTIHECESKKNHSLKSEICKFYSKRVIFTPKSEIQSAKIAYEEHSLEKCNHSLKAIPRVILKVKSTLIGVIVGSFGVKLSQFSLF